MAITMTTMMMTAYVTQLESRFLVTSTVTVNRFWFVPNCPSGVHTTVRV